MLNYYHPTSNISNASSIRMHKALLQLSFTTLIASRHNLSLKDSHVMLQQPGNVPTGTGSAKSHALDFYTIASNEIATDHCKRQEK